MSKTFHGTGNQDGDDAIIEKALEILEQRARYADHVSLLLPAA